MELKYTKHSSHLGQEDIWDQKPDESAGGAFLAAGFILLVLFLGALLMPHFH